MTAPRTRRLGWWVAGGVGLVLLALMAGTPTQRGGSPLDPSSTAPGGTRAMVVLLRESGATVSVSGDPPEARGDVAVLLADTTTPEESDTLQRWVDRGGTLVVADPRSSFAPKAAGTTSLLAGIETPVGRGVCDVPALNGIERLKPASTSYLFEVPEGASGCFGPGNGAMVVDVPSGAGHIVAVGGPSVFTNEALAHDDNGALAVALMAPRNGTTVTVLYGGGKARTSLLGLLPVGVRLALAQLALAWLVYAWFRGRRLGHPVSEVQPVQIAGSELARAVGNLLHQTRDPNRAARLLRADLRRRLSERLGLPPDSSAEVVAEVTASRTDVDRARVARAVTDIPVHSEDELLDLARDIDTIRTEVLHGTAP